MPKKTIDLKSEALLFMLALLPLITLLVLNTRIPDQVPVHFNFQGEPNRYGSPWELVTLNMLLYPLMLLPLFIDPHRQNLTRFQATYFSLRLVVLGFISSLSCALLADAAGLYDLHIARFLPIGVLLLLAAFGNFMVNLRHNYFVGIRTPWTLHSEQVWQATHRFSGRLWLGMGLVGALAWGVLRLEQNGPWLALWIGIMVVAPIIFSYWQWRALEH